MQIANHLSFNFVSTSNTSGAKEIFYFQGHRIFVLEISFVTTTYFAKTHSTLLIEPVILFST